MAYQGACRRSRLYVNEDLIRTYPAASQSNIKYHQDRLTFLTRSPVAVTQP